MKVISFSLWGSSKKYTTGAIRNAELAPLIYPNWVYRFYVGRSTPEEVIEQLKILGSEIIKVDEPGDWRGMFWRFLPAGEENVEVMISRDCDSRLNKREKDAVDHWLSSSKPFHIMRDHPLHSTVILGGMWGAKKGTLPNIKSQIDKWNQQDLYQTDQWFLRQNIYPLIFNKVMVHDEFFEKKTFPTFRTSEEFVGEPFDENDNADQALRNALTHSTSERIQYAAFNRWIIGYNTILARTLYYFIRLFSQP